MSSHHITGAADERGDCHWERPLLCICSENQLSKTEAYDGQKCAQTPVGEKGDAAVPSPNLN